MADIVENQNFIYDKFENINFANVKLQNLKVHDCLEIYAVKKITTKFGDTFMMLDNLTKNIYQSNKKDTRIIDEYLQFCNTRVTEYKYPKLRRDGKPNMNIYTRRDLQPFLNICVLDTTYNYKDVEYKQIEYTYENKEIIYDYRGGGRGWVDRRDFFNEQQLRGCA